MLLHPNANEKFWLNFKNAEYLSYSECGLVQSLGNGIKNDVHANHFTFRTRFVLTLYYEYEYDFMDLVFLSSTGHLFNQKFLNCPY